MQLELVEPKPFFVAITIRQTYKGPNNSRTRFKSEQPVTAGTATGCSGQQQRKLPMVMFQIDPAYGLGTDYLSAVARALLSLRCAQPPPS